MPLTPRDVDHAHIVTTLGFLALDCPAFAPVVRSLVITLYGPEALPTFDTVLREFEPLSASDAVRLSVGLPVVTPRAEGSTSS
jgi:hypothetical protein